MLVATKIKRLRRFSMMPWKIKVGSSLCRRSDPARVRHRVAEAIESCSDSVVSDPEQKLPWRERKEKYLAHLPHASEDALIIGAADKLHNARAILTDYRQVGEELWSRFKVGKEEHAEPVEHLVP
jgi:hypothetical protein